jgi:hypothetical protein
MTCTSPIGVPHIDICLPDFLLGKRVSRGEDEDCTESESEDADEAEGDAAARFGFSQSSARTPKRRKLDDGDAFGLKDVQDLQHLWFRTSFSQVLTFKVGLSAL